MICGEEGEKHHIIHKDEGGLDYPLNYIYLCKKHHRGPLGPHQDQEVDEKYKRFLLLTLTKVFQNEFYKSSEIKSTIRVSNNLLRSLKETLKQYKEGYKQMDIIDFLLSGNIVRLDEDKYDGDYFSETD